MLTKEVRDALSAPIPVDEIGFKPQVTTDDSALMVAYVDARWVAERLDDATDGDWHFTWDDLGLHGDNLVIKATLTVCGMIRQDVGEYKIEGSYIDPYKSAVSDALKRAAVLFGVGRELYRMQSHWIKWDKQRKRPMPGEMESLRAKLLSAQVPWNHLQAEVQSFYNWANKNNGMTDKEAREALGVDLITEFKGSKKDALEAVRAFLAKK